MKANLGSDHDAIGSTDASATRDDEIARLKAENATLKRYRTIFESEADVAIVATDHDGLITDWNRGATKIFGWSAETMTGQAIDRIFTSEDLARGRPAVEMREAREAGRASDRRWHVHANGERFFANGEMLPLCDATDALVGYLKVFADRTESRRADQKVRLSEERLGVALAAAGMVGVWDWDILADRVYADANFAKIYSVDPKKAAHGTPIADFISSFHPDDIPAFQTELDRVTRDGGAFSAEYRIIQPDGSVRWLLARGSMIVDDEGTPSRFPGASVDITERKIAESRHAALLELGDRFRDLRDPADMAFVAAEVLGRTLEVGRAGYGTIDPVLETITIERDWNAPNSTSLAGSLHFRDFGSYIDDLKRNETVICPDARLDPRTIDTADALQGIGTRAFVNMPIFEEGHFVALLFLTAPVPRAWTTDELVFIRDVADRTRAATERRRVERSLHDLAASLEREVSARTADRNRLWTLSSDIMLVAGFDADILAVNPAWKSVLGWDESELVGAKLPAFLHPDDIERTQDAIRSLAESGKLPRFENRYRHKDGSYRSISWTVVIGDNLINAVGRDITEQREQEVALRRTEEQLRQAQKMEAVGQLTGGIAHDFNNLLTGITGSLDMLGVRVTQGRTKELDRYIQAAQGAASRAAALTHRLLAFSRRQTLDPRPTSVNRLVLDMEDLLRRTVGPAVTVEVVGAAGLWIALVDPNQLENALLNLCINARDAMPDGGRLTIETANKWLDDRAANDRDITPGQYLSLCVTDTGTGMSPEIIERAFDPFFTTKPLGSGTGLGLSMIYGFARQSGGTVRVYSEVGHGTTMCIYLPRHLGAVQENETINTATPIHAGSGETVLVIDDEPTVRMLVAEILIDLGYRALEAHDGASGLEILRSNARIDLLITDVGLPGGMNGRQVADAGRVLRPDLKVLFITGYAENAVVGNGHLDHGMRIMTKPFAMESLGVLIREMIERD